MNVQKVVELARVADTVLVGDDTDILGSICGYYKGTGCTNSDTPIHEEDDTDTNTE